MIRIIRYSDTAQKILKTKTEPKPWLHCIMDIQMKPGTGRSQGTLKYAIYIWDTRVVLEFNDKGVNINTAQVLALLNQKLLRNALDNHTPLNGCRFFDSLLREHASKDVIIRSEETLNILKTLGIEDTQDYIATELKQFKQV